MKLAKASFRYARALFVLANETGAGEKTLKTLREIRDGIERDPEIAEALRSPLFKQEDLKNALKAALVNGSGPNLVSDFVMLLVEKQRIGIFSDIVRAYEIEHDAAAGVARGAVRSPSPLDQSERTEIEKFVSKITKKKAVLDYEESPELIGGLVAQVGSYLFDDSLRTQLGLMEGYLKRSAH